MMSLFVFGLAIMTVLIGLLAVLTEAKRQREDFAARAVRSALCTATDCGLQARMPER